MKKLAVLSLLILFLALSCKEPFIEPNGNPLFQTWVFRDYDFNAKTNHYSSEITLKPDYPGYIFKEDGTLKARINSGSCGTPPIAYSNYDGNWYYENDSLIQIITEYWATDKSGPFLEYSFEIIKVDYDTLIVRVIN